MDATSEPGANLVQFVSENYVGPARVQRLAFIAEHSERLRESALRLALSELRNSSNTLLYSDLIEKRLPDLCAQLGIARDAAWVEGVDKRSQQQHDKLEHDLAAAKTNLNKEAIRVRAAPHGARLLAHACKAAPSRRAHAPRCALAPRRAACNPRAAAAQTCHNELGDLHAARGDYVSALKSYVRARDYCTTAKHVLAMCLNVVKVSVLMGSYTHVLTYVAKAEQTPDADEPLVLTQLKACAGLAHLEAAKYKLAAKKLCECTGELNFAELVLPRDVALCGGLCALAALSRAELRACVLESHAFRSLLELTPLLRDAIHAFHGARYAACLQSLEQLKPELLLEPFLRPHVERLCAQVRTKALVSYFVPYRAVSMAAMAAAFSTELPLLEKELVGLITEGTIFARIDSAAKVLYAQRAEQRRASFAKAAQMGDEYAHECKVGPAPSLPRPAARRRSSPRCPAPRQRLPGGDCAHGCEPRSAARSAAHRVLAAARARALPPCVRLCPRAGVAAARQPAAR